MNSPAIQPSATLILLRQTASGMETLLLKRHREMAFGSAWVFPGGKIDREDHEKAAKIPANYDNKGGPDQQEISAAYHAAIRESREEAGVDMDEKHLVLMSCWTTPALGDRPRFRTWFFAGELNHQEIVVDGREMLDYRWINVGEAIKPASVRELNMLPPTYNTLVDINRYPDVLSTLAALRNKPLQVYNPKLVPMEGGYASLYEGDAGYESGNPDVPGARHRLRVDKDGYHLEKTS